MRMMLMLLPLLAMSAALSAEPTYELHQTFTIPAGGWIRTNPGATIPVYECDPHALDEVAGRADAFIVLPRGLGVFIASGRGDFYYWQVSRSMQAALPERRDLAQLVGEGVPDALIRELEAGATP